MSDLDRTIFLLINDSAAPGLVDLLAKQASSLVVLLLVAHFLCGIVMRWHDVRTALQLGLFMAAGLTASYLVGWAMPVDRPFVQQLGHHLVLHAATPSFPSSHGLLIFTYSVVLTTAGKRRSGFFFFAGGLLVAWARIRAGVHFPFDMMGALGLALMLGMVASVTLRRFSVG